MNKPASGRIAGINTSIKKGTVKRPVTYADLRADFGIEGDVHAGSGSTRQVSMLTLGSLEKMKKELGEKIKPGVFGENFDMDGIGIGRLPVGAKIKFSGGAQLRVTKIGKECHAGCEISKICGKCVMPEEGIFCSVEKGGTVKEGDSFYVL